MRVIDRGAGRPIVLIPGIQGRWAYMEPAVAALAGQFRVITFDLCGERGAAPFDPQRGFADCLGQIDAALDERELERAVICGVSFGGLIALQYAATRPARTMALVLASTPGPQFRLRDRHRMYLRAPWVFGPLFLAELPFRVRRELARAIPGLGPRLRFSVRQLVTALRAPVSVTRMARRAALIGTIDAVAASRAITAPTLIVCGEPALDYVVPVDGSCAYETLIPNARVRHLEGTGHLGYITQPALFTETIRTFLDGVHHAAA